MNLPEIHPVDAAIAAQARARQQILTKPPGSLGRLESLAVEVAAARATATPRVDAAAVVVFAADHGVAAEGVSAYPQAVTAQMVANFARGGAAVNALAKAAGARLVVVDVGVAVPIEGLDVRSHRIAPGTRNITVEPAMSRDEAEAAVNLGMALAYELADAGVDLLALGEMGIANTTAAAALTAALTGAAAQMVAGRGTGVDDEGLARKRDAVRRALERHRRDFGDDDGFDLLRSLGGLEIAAMCGAYLGAAARRIPILMDGFISTCAAAVAVRLRPEVAGYLLAAHRSMEPGHALLLSHLGKLPLLDLDMRLGEASGAALAIPIVRAALAVHAEMATFAEAGVSDRAADAATT